MQANGLIGGLVSQHHASSWFTKGIKNIHLSRFLTHHIFTYVWFSQLGAKLITFSFVSLGRRTVSQKPRPPSHQPMNRREVLRAGLERVAQQRELKEQQARPQIHTTTRKGRDPERRKADTVRVLDLHKAICRNVTEEVSNVQVIVCSVKIH